MLCENIFCIYYEDEECVLGETELDMTGSCKNCIYVSIPEKELKEKREKLLNRYSEEL